MRLSLLLRSVFATALLAGCSVDARTSTKAPQQNASSLAIVASLRARPALAWPSVTTTWARDRDRLRPTTAAPAGAWQVAGSDQLGVEVPTRADGAVRLSYRALPEFWIELVPEGVDGVSGEVVDAAVVFPEATRATDLVHVARPAAIEELRVLRRPEAARTLRWSLRKGPGVGSVRVDEDGAIVAKHVGGSAQFVAPRPFAIDDDAKRVPLTVSVDDRADVAILQITVDAAHARFPVVVDPQWATTASMSVPRIMHQATLLPDGRVLVTGGTTYVTQPAFSSTEIYDETKGTFTAGPNMSVPRIGHTATMMLDGKVMIAGGYRNDPAYGTYLSSVEIYDPATNTFTAGPSLPAVRGQHGAALTKSGHVALVGGKNGSASDAVLNNGLDYNPTTKTWRTSISGAMQVGRYAVATALIGDSTVLVAGGFASTGYSTLVDSFFPEYSMAAYWGSAKPMSQQRVWFELAVTAAGDVLAAGGGNLATAEIYRKAAFAWEPAGSPASTHGGSTSTVLDDGRILVVGGGTNADIYDPLAAGPTIAWKPAGNMSAPRGTHRAVKLKSGRVLVVGGYTPGTQVPISTAEIFTTLPQGSPCTDAGECATGFCVDGFCCDKACEGQCEACDLAKKGTCGNVIGAPHGTRTKCGGAASCVDDVAIGEPVCDGSGSCAAPMPQSCLPFKCASGACLTSCTTNADCAGANVCFEGTCAARQGVCSADHASTTLSGQTTPTPCGSYRCRDEDGLCAKTCSSTADCASGFACDVASGQCTQTATEDSGGCDLGHTSSAGRFAVLALAAASVALARIRKRK